MLEDIILPKFGVPIFLFIDGGSHFLNSTFRKVFSKHGISHRMSTTYHPQTSFFLAIFILSKIENSKHATRWKYLFVIFLIESSIYSKHNKKNMKR
jgi:transposase InsO family protein